MTPAKTSPLQQALHTVSLAARGEERFFAPGGETRRARLAVPLAIVFVIYAGALAWFLHRDSAAVADLVAQAPEVPIEVVQEPPPAPPEPEPAPQQEAKQEAKQQLDEKPATSAPRAPPEHAVDTQVSEKETEALKAAAPPRDGQPGKGDAVAASPSATAPASAADAKLEDDRSDAEALDKAKTETGKPADAARQLAGLSETPTYRFAAASKLADFPAGTEDNRYLSIVYAKVMSKNRYRASAAARRGLRGVVSVSFVVDFMGRVPYQAVSESSGHPDLDALAMAAVRTAAPFPSPPGSGSQQLVARMQFGPDGMEPPRTP